MIYFFLFYLTGLILVLFLIGLKVRFPELDSMFLISMAGVIAVPLIREGFNRLKTKELLDVLKKRTGKLPPDDPEEKLKKPKKK